MITSEKVEEITAALVAVAIKIQDPTRDKTNPHFKSTYVTLDAVIQATRALLAENNIVVVQSPGTSDMGLAVTTRLLHSKSGQWIEDTLTMPLGGNPTAQSVGSAITYARRYSLQSMLNLGAEDDDGHAASTSSRQQPQKRGKEPVKQADAQSSRPESKTIEALVCGVYVNDDPKLAKEGWHGIDFGEGRIAETKDAGLVSKAKGFMEVGESILVEVETVPGSDFPLLKALMPTT